MKVFSSRFENLGGWGHARPDRLIKNPILHPNSAIFNLKNSNQSKERINPILRGSQPLCKLRPLPGLFSYYCLYPGVAAQRPYPLANGCECFGFPPERLPKKDSL